MTKSLLLIASHAIVGALGFAAGIYYLPILTAPPAPSAAELQAVAAQAMYSAELRRDLAGSDALHWGEGRVSITPERISLQGEIAPGPDYKLYLSPEFVETETQFNAIKDRMTRIGDVRTFKNFVVNVPRDVDPTDFTTVVIWCEAFGEFISAAKYR
jgi:hypothetical protein